jgi:hypothetical protein
MKTILEQMMAKLDAHEEKTDANARRKTIKKLTDAIRAETKAKQAELEADME